MQFVSNYPNSFVGPGYAGMNMPVNMGYMSQHYPPNEAALASYTHNLNMMSANMNPFGNIPPPPEHPMPDFAQGGVPRPPDYEHPQNPDAKKYGYQQESVIKKEEN